MLDDRQDTLQRDGIDASPSQLRLISNDQDPEARAELVGFLDRDEVQHVEIFLIV